MIHKEIFILVCLLSTGKLVQCKQICSKNQYIIIDAPANQPSCLSCNNCPEGSGLHPPCGSTLTYSHINIDCLACTGNTYSDEHGPSSCKACAICSANEIVNKHCTAYKNTVCSKTCVKGYYYDTNTHGCQPCSECCGNDGDVRIEECKSYSMPLSKQCSVHQRQHCRGSTVTTQSQPYVTTLPSSPGRTPSSKHTSNKTTALIAGFSVFGIVLIMSIIIIICILKKRGRIHVPCRDKERNDIECENLDGHDNNVAMGLQEPPVPSLDDLPKCQEGQRYKLLTELHHETHGQLEDILAPDDPDGNIGNWYNLGLEYQMEKFTLDQLKTNRDCKEASRNVLEFIAAAKPDLTVHDLCTTLKKIKQKDALDLLKGHMLSNVVPCES